MLDHLSEIIRIAFGRSSARDTPMWLPHTLLATAMCLFYASRWFAEQVPPSTKGLIFPAEHFYGLSALCSILVWPLMVEVSARALNRLSAHPSKSHLIDAKRRYAFPLFFWLGCIEFSVWLASPASIFRLVAPMLLAVAMGCVIFHFYQLLRAQAMSWHSAAWRGLLALCPQLVIAGLFIR